jgi:hypothetical protein
MVPSSKLHQLNLELTWEQVEDRFPGALKELRKQYTFFHEEDPEEFDRRFTGMTPDELIHGKLKFYTVWNPDYSFVEGQVTVAFHEPFSDDEKNVWTSWLGETWDMNFGLWKYDLL